MMLMLLVVCIMRAVVRSVNVTFCTLRQAVLS